MSEDELGYKGLKEETISVRERIDPRQNGKMFSYPVEIGTPFNPDKEHFPGWLLTPIVLKDERIKQEIDGCIFEVAAGTACQVGLVGESLSAKNAKINLAPEFIEWIIEGSGKLEIETPGDKKKVIDVNSDRLVRFRYGKGTKVRYVAGPNGLVGVSIGIPAGVDEAAIPNF